jgi:hypothetical protein
MASSFGLYLSNRIDPKDLVDSLARSFYFYGFLYRFDPMPRGKLTTGKALTMDYLSVVAASYASN